MDPNDPDKRHPELRIHVDVLLRWINPLIQLANKRPLTNDDVWPCPPKELVEVQSAAFWRGWEQECERAYEQGRKPSFLWALALAYGDRLVLTGVFQIIFLILQLIQPFLVGELVKYIQTGDGGIETGIGLALGFGAVAFVSSIVLSQVFYLLRRLGDVLRAGVMMAVYEQTLRLTTAARLQNTIGQTTNLIAIDAEKLNLAVQFIHFLWHGPCVSLAIMIILITEIGYQAALVGIGFLMLLVPLQNHVAASIGFARRHMIRFTDERVKLINELLQAIRVIKLYAWESPIEERVREVRETETTHLHSYLNRSGILRELLFAAQPVAAVLMFTTATYGASRPLTVVQVFRMLAFLGITRFPLNLLAQALKFTNDAMVSIHRLENFFLLPVLSSHGRTQAEAPEIVLDKATFTWQDLQSSLPTSSRRRGHSKSSTKHEPVPVEDVESNEAELWLSKSFSLRSLTFRTHRSNELVAVIGSVGSGKSSLISALLNEMNLYAGKANIQGTVSFCAQTPWIQNLTLKQNVLFAVSADSLTEKQAEDYRLAVHAAALAADISILAHGDSTEIGERGINLSGGQKARVSLARAFFSRYRSQIYLLDDPFSAVDGNTGNHIFQHGILSLLQDKLRVIALNSHMHLLKHFDRILVMQEGRIVLDGNFESLFEEHEELMARITGLTRSASSSSSSTALSSMATGLGEKGREEGASTSPSPPPPTPMDIAPAPDTVVERSDEPAALSGSDADKDQGSVRDPATVSPPPLPSLSLPVEAAQPNTTIPTTTTTTTQQTSSPTTLLHSCSVLPPPLSTSSSKSPTNGTLIKAELTQTKTTLWGAYVQYVSASVLSLQRIVEAPFYHSSSSQSRDEQDSLYTRGVYALGLVAIFTMIVVFSAVQLFRVGVDILLAKLAEEWDTSLRARHLYERWYYICFGLLIATMGARAFYVNYFAVRSSRVLHSQILRKVLAAPVPAFFDTHTIGAILNRFAKDMEVVDANIPEFMLQLVMNWFQVFSVFGLCIWASPWFTIILVPMAGLFRNIYVYFSAASRDLKKLESVSRSPIYASLSETLAGLETIRAYSDTPRFLTMHLQRMDLNKKLLFHLWICMSWMTVRLEMSTASVLFTVAIICVCLRDHVSPIALGIALSFGLQLTALFQRCVQLVIEMVTYMTSTERVLDYMDLPQEKDTLREEKRLSKAEMSKAVVAMEETNQKVPPDWPREGSIVLDDVWMSYRDNPAVLRGISVQITSGQRIGVCGRTGAGKSSVMMALFRIVELSQGRILIDGRDIATVPLRTLRSALAIIPQDPVLFTGTIRFQLDPFQQHSDADVWTALEQVRMADMVRSLPQGLQDIVKENGENLSQGQRQLLCIARALLRKAKILVVDEGTSAVDPYTDELIQQVLRQEVEQHGATVLAIAHRLQTIADFDKILVLGAGQVLEFGSPKDLLVNPSSVFASMMAESAH